LMGANILLGIGGGSVRIAVVGGGAIGLYTAYEALKRGYKVDLYEARPRIGDSASGRMPGLLMAIDRPFHSLKNRLVMWGMKLHRELSREIGYEIRDVELLLPYDSRLLDRLMWIARLYMKYFGFDIEIVRGGDLRRRYPEINKRFIGAIRMEGFGIVDPLDVLLTLQERIVEMGGGIFLGYRVPPLHDRVINGVEYDAVVVAAGPHTREIARNVDPKPPRQRFGKGIYAVTSLEIDYILLRFRVTGWKYTRGYGFAPYYKGIGSIFGATFSWAPAKEDYDADYSLVAQALTEGSDVVNDEPDIISVHCVPRVINYPRGDWIIRVRRGFALVYGVSTPGFTAAPAIARYILERLNP